MNLYHQKISREELAKFIDHTSPRPEVNNSEIEKICREAVKYHFIAVCIPPYYTSLGA